MGAAVILFRIRQWRRPMEYLVTMTTQVPDGTSEADVQEIRDRESARSKVLATQGHLRRLWRPPLQPGEWRTLGLFDAADDTLLEQVLTSMPLHIWRTDQVERLAPHPNDPLGRVPTPGPPGPDRGSSEFLTRFALSMPSNTPEAAFDAATAQEAVSARALADDGHLIRLWRLPAYGGALGLWRAHEIAEMRSLLSSLPLDRWLTERITVLSPHPSDPGLTDR
jgi:muconolactone delta-isomerase